MAKGKTTEKKTDKVQSLRSHAHVLLRPRITEKASALSMNSNVYVFEVTKDVTKKQVADAVSSFYKVDAVKVAMVPITRKQVTVRGKKGMTAGGKKAYVYLKKGDKIEFI